MKKCRYCGRENDDAFVQCWECGTELPGQPKSPPAKKPSQFSLFEDPTKSYRQESARESLKYAPQLRCRCGGVMNAYYVNETFIMYFIPMGHSMSYRCHLCNHELGIISPGYMVLITLVGLMIFGGVFMAAIMNETWHPHIVVYCIVLSCVAVACLYAVYTNIRKMRSHRKI